ncbi:MAG: YggS family pyridoxal phosphate-dependent enzyme [Armatimonadota bacterium]
MSIAENIKIIKQRIYDAAAKTGVNPDGISLIAVTKTVGADMINEALDAGIKDIGENYVQDALTKYEAVERCINWHMIGHLQTNKVRLAVPAFNVIQSVDRLDIAKEIAKRSLASETVTKALVEVNISGEESKSGVHPADAIQLCEDVSSLSGIQLAGLMGIAPFTEDETAIRKSFENLRKLWDKLPSEHAKWLSMGMTSDFEIAIEEGSNMVRIGTAIFGSRPPKD